MRPTNKSKSGWKISSGSTKKASLLRDSCETRKESVNKLFNVSYDQAIYEELGSFIALPIYETALTMEFILFKNCL